MCNLQNEIHINECSDDLQHTGSRDKNISIACKEIKLLLISNWGSLDMIGKYYLIKTIFFFHARNNVYTYVISIRALILFFYQFY